MSNDLRTDLGMTEDEYRKLWYDVQFGHCSGITRVEIVGRKEVCLDEPTRINQQTTIGEK